MTAIGKHMHGNKGNRRTWNFARLVKLEAYRLLDRDVSPEDFEKRDRAIFARYPGKRTDRLAVFDHWLRERERQDPLEFDPAEKLNSLFKWVSFLVVLTGLIAGWGLAYTTLRYSGDVPVNVAVFLGIIVLPQLCLLFLLGLVALSFWWYPSLVGKLYSFPLWVVRSFVGWAWKEIRRRHLFGRKKEDEWRLSQRDAADWLHVHRRIWMTRTFLWMQQLGIFFNLGVLLCAWVLLMFTDRAFGWQSSFTDSAEQVSRWVEVIATPWKSWLGAGAGYPGLEEIRGSRIVLSERGIHELSAQHLVSWWPFLLLCVVTYGLIPRLLAWAMGWTVWKSVERRPQLDASAYDPIWERMQSQQIVSSGQAATRRAEHPDNGEQEPVTIPRAPMHVWYPADMEERYDLKHLQSWSSLTGQWNLAEVTPFRHPAEIRRQGSQPILLLLEGWQPPIEETLQDLREVGQRLGSGDQPVFCVLVGKPSQGKPGALAPVMVETWRQKVRLLGRVHLQVVSLKDEEVRVS